MAVQIRINQSAVPGDINRSRDDIVAGTEVEIENVSPGTSNAIALLWKPPDDDTAVFVPDGDNWKITPKAGTWGRVRFRVTVDGEVLVKTFTVKSPVYGLSDFAANERANPDASLIDMGAAKIEASETNQAFGPFSSGSAFGWWRVIRRIIEVLETLTGGGLEWTDEKTGNYTAAVGEFVLCDPSGGAFQVDAPATPSDNDQFGVKNHTDSTTAITIDGNGKNFDGGASTREINQANQWRIWQFSTTADEWLERG